MGGASFCAFFGDGVEERKDLSVGNKDGKEGLMQGFAILAVVGVDADLSLPETSLVTLLSFRCRGLQKPECLQPQVVLVV